MAGAQRDVAIETKVDAGSSKPAARSVGEESLGRADRERRAPDQQPHVEPRPILHEAGQQVTDFG